MSCSTSSGTEMRNGSDMMESTTLLRRVPRLRAGLAGCIAGAIGGLAAFPRGVVSGAADGVAGLLDLVAVFGRSGGRLVLPGANQRGEGEKERESDGGWCGCTHERLPPDEFGGSV